MKTRNDFGLVILHYGNIHVTKECLKSLINCNISDYPICIVLNSNIENNNFNEFKEHLQLEFHNTYRNIGFAKGMNTGIKILIDKYHCQNIACVNNDIRFIDGQMFLKMKKIILNNDTIAIIGPNILNLDGINQNPIPLANFNLLYIVKRLVKNLIGLLLLYLNININQKKLFKTKRKIKSFDEYMLHGACFILTKNYFYQFKGLYNKTFLYAEEYILYYLVRKHGMVPYCLNSTSVIHNEHSSTREKHGSQRKLMIFRLKNESFSLMMLIRLMIKGED